MDSSGPRTEEQSVTAADVERAAELIAGDVRETLVLPAGALSRRFKAPVVLKAEIGGWWRPAPATTPRRWRWRPTA